MGVPPSRGAGGDEIRTRQLHPGKQTALSCDAFYREEGIRAVAEGITTAATADDDIATPDTNRRRQFSSVCPEHNGPILAGN
jgi:hypothetical protein